MAARVDVPVLCKDFVVDPYQLWEARAHGAELVLLIVAALAGRSSPTCCTRHGRPDSPLLVEVHDEAEAEQAVAAGATVIGVNARDLKTLEVDRTTFARVAPHIPADVVRIAESGVRGPWDVAEYARAGADAVLVGQALVTAGRPRHAVSELLRAHE
ncbi:Indole-3-glycerol phosphate synthase OS=Streptomyces tendae OX=1932 GN=trpC PE=3 SV=1 [Streptomyces tendae]